MSEKKKKESKKSDRNDALGAGSDNGSSIIGYDDRNWHCSLSAFSGFLRKDQSGNKKDDLKKEVKKEKAEEETKDEEDLKEDVLQEEDESSDLEDEFWIDEDTKADYSENLDPDLYESYDSKITAFKFYYPVDLYNEVSVDEDPDLVSYGENCQTITFEGSDGSQLIFSLTSRTDALSIENMTENVYNIESKG